MVASHTAVPLGTANQRSLFAKRGKVNGWYGVAPNNIACPWVGDMVCVCPLPKGKVPGVWFGLTSHFEKPKGFSVWLATLVRCLWHPLCKRPHCILSLLTAPCLLPTTSSLLTGPIRCRWHHFLSDIANACLIVIKLHIRKNGDLSNNIRILTPKNRGCWSRKSHSVKKTAIFAVFGKALIDRRLRGYRFVI